jgi:hypothetical protein
VKNNTLARRLADEVENQPPKFRFFHDPVFLELPSRRFSPSHGLARPGNGLLYVGAGGMITSSGRFTNGTTFFLVSSPDDDIEGIDTSFILRTPLYRYLADVDTR